MKGCRFYAFLIVVTTFLLLTSAWAETVNQEQNKEIFIGQFKGGISAKWCGNNALVVEGGLGSKVGIEWIDILSRKTIKISSYRPIPDRKLWQKNISYGQDYALNCTPDGNWVVYVDRKSGRADKGYKSSDDLDWDVVDLYRYEVATGKRQKFAVLRDLQPLEAVSPDGKKIFLGSKHNSTIEMPEPKWDSVWFKNDDWVQSGAKWFLDSSGIITQYDERGIGVEFFGKNGWAKMFELQFGEISRVTVDKHNRVYFRGDGDLYRCNIKNRDLSCEKIGRGKTFYGVSPDGNIVFMEEKDCISYLDLRQSESKEKCIAEKRKEYNLKIKGISPDGKWLAFVRGNFPKTKNSVYDITESNLFIIKLTNQ